MATIDPSTLETLDEFLAHTYRQIITAATPDVMAGQSIDLRSWKAVLYEGLFFDYDQLGGHTVSRDGDYETRYTRIGYDDGAGGAYLFTDTDQLNNTAGMTGYELVHVVEGTLLMRRPVDSVDTDPGSQIALEIDLHVSPERVYMGESTNIYRPGNSVTGTLEEYDGDAFGTIWTGDRFFFEGAFFDETGVDLTIDAAFTHLSSADNDRYAYGEIQVDAPEGSATIASPLMMWQSTYYGRIGQTSDYGYLQQSAGLTVQQLETGTELTVVDRNAPTPILQVMEAQLDHNLSTIAFDTWMPEGALLFALSPGLRGVQNIAVRIAEIGLTGASVQLVETAELDGTHALEDVVLLAVTPGVHTLADGTVIEAGLYADAPDVTGDFASVDFSARFDDRPAIFAQVQATDDVSWTTTRLRGADADGFDFALQGEEADLARAPQNVGWLAIETGTGAAGGMVFEAGHTPMGANGRYGDIDFSADLGSDPLAMAAMSSMHGTDSAAMRMRAVDAGGFTAIVQEDQSLDGERDHYWEDIDWIAFNGEGVINELIIT